MRHFEPETRAPAGLVAICGDVDGLASWLAAEVSGSVQLAHPVASVDVPLGAGPRAASLVLDGSGGRMRGTRVEPVGGAPALRALRLPPDGPYELVPIAAAALRQLVGGRGDGPLRRCREADHPGREDRARATTFVLRSVPR